MNDLDAQAAVTDLHSSLPRLQQIAWELRIPVDVLRPALQNQGLWLGPDDRVPFLVVIEALERELEAGRPVSPQPMQRA